MGDPPHWDLLEVEALQDCAVFHVERRWVRSPRSGERLAFYGIRADPWVNVIPVTDDGRFVLVRQYRHGARDVTLEIPGGVVDPGETPAEAAVRELREETGYGEGTLEPLGSVNPNPALFDNQVSTFVARGVRRVGEIQNSGREETAVTLLDRDEVDRALREGRIDHALVVAAFLWLRLQEDSA